MKPVLVFLFSAILVANGSCLFDDLKNTQTINEKLCQSGTHDDATAAKFFACYSKVTGGKQYVECQNQVYGNPMDTEAHIDTVCTANKFPAYAGCLLVKFGLNGVNPAAAIRQLNACQGPIVGISV